MIPPKYKFYIINESRDASLRHEVTPHYKELNKKYAKESGQEFFRISLEGKMTLFGSDFEVVYEANINDKFIFIIDMYERATNKWAEYYRGEFSKTDCKFDYEKKSCELKTSPIDQYTQVMNKYDNTYDLIKLAPAISKINLHKRSLMQVYVRGANSVSNFVGGTYWESDVNEVIDKHEDLINKYYFSYIDTGNEFYVEGAGVSAVNGVYAGTSGNWQKWSGYSAELVKTINNGDRTPETIPTVYDIYSTNSRQALTNAYQGGGATYNENLYKLQIIRNSDDAVIYESEWLFYLGTNETGSSNAYINREDIKMVNTSNSSDYFTITNVFVYHIYRRLLCDVDSLIDSEGVKETYDLPAEDFITDNRNYKKCIGLRGGLFFCTSRTVSTPTKYGVNDYGQYFTSEFIPASAGLGRALPISRNFWANASLWFVYDTWYQYWEESSRKMYTLRDSYSIGAVIKAMLNEIDPTLTHEETAEYSRFLYNTSVPISMQRFYVYITQKTNILKGDYDQAAQKAEITFEDLMNMLRDCFRCYWYIEDGKFKVEHIYYFMNGGSYSQQSNYQLDFTKLTDQFNSKNAAYFQSNLEYDKTDLNARYEFNWMDNATEVFGGVTLDIDANYIQKDKTQEINASQFSSDIDFMLFNPSNFSEDGFALLCPVKSGSTLTLPIITATLFDENDNFYDAIAQNWYASWNYLLRFYLYDLPAYYYVKCNNYIDFIDVNDVKKCMKQDIECFSENDLNTLQLIKTSIGNGKIESMAINLDTRKTKVELRYRPK